MWLNDLAITSHDLWSPDLEGERIEVSSVEIIESRKDWPGMAESSGSVVDSKGLETYDRDVWRRVPWFFLIS